MSLFQELKRRNVFRVAILYIVAAWLLLQIADVAISLLDLPEWVGRFVFLLVALGAIPALLISWLYELTPDGLKREHEVADSERITHETGRKINVLIGVFGVVIVGSIIADRLVPKTVTTAVPDAAVAEAADDKSIAVLPFADMSPDGDHEFFSDGVSEELLDLLAKIPELRVISRTSSFQFKGQNADIRTIAETLAVSNILEGSVRKSGNRIRVTAQLIRGNDGAHLWSETYDRDLDDIFAVQDDIAGAVVSELRIKLLGESSRTIGQTSSSEAHTLYLQGRYFGEQRSLEGLTKAEDFLKEALELDPVYAKASAALSRVYGAMEGSGLMARDNLLSDARATATRAIELAPELADGHLALAYIYIFKDWDWPAARAAIERAAQLEPGSADILRQRGTLAAILGRFEEAIEYYRQSLALDPLRAGTFHNYGKTLSNAGRPQEAEAVFRRKLLLADYGTQAEIGISLLHQNKPEEAYEWINREPAEIWRLARLPIVLHALEKNSESDAAVQDFIDTIGASAAFQIAEVYAYRGELDKAIAWLEQAYELRDGGMIEVGISPLLTNLHGDPRFDAILQKMKLTL